MSELIYYLISIIGGVIAGLLYYLNKRKTDPILAKVIEHLTNYYLDEKFFSIKKISEELGLPQEVVEKAIIRLEKAGVVLRTSKGYSLVDPLVFLTPRDYERALRLTKGDNIIYGAYQLFYTSHPLIMVIMWLSILIPFALFVCVLLGIDPVINLLESVSRGQIDPLLLTLLFIGIGIVIYDLVDNIIKAWNREKYSVVVGFHSGILYDLHPADELSGRIRRGGIARIDIDMNLVQRLNNFFGSTPVGDVKIWLHGKKEPVIFKSMPYPRELFLVIRSIQLGNLAWRKKHARELALWRGRVYPFIPYSRRGRGRR